MFEFRSKRLLRLFAEIALFGVVFLAIQAWQQRDIPSGKAPQTCGDLTDGTAFCLGQWFKEHPDDRVVALHFWADWCPICASEQGSINSLAKDWPVVSVAMQSGNAAAINAYMKKEGLAWTTLVDDTGRISSDYRLKGVPAYFVVDRNGMIRSVSVGYTTELGMRARLWWANRF